MAGAEEVRWHLWNIQNFFLDWIWRVCKCHWYLSTVFISKVGGSRFVWIMSRSRVSILTSSKTLSRQSRKSRHFQKVRFDSPPTPNLSYNSYLPVETSKFHPRLNMNSLQLPQIYMDSSYNLLILWGTFDVSFLIEYKEFEYNCPSTFISSVYYMRWKVGGYKRFLAKCSTVYLFNGRIWLIWKEWCILDLFFSQLQCEKNQFLEKLTLQNKTNLDLIMLFSNT